MDYTVLPGPELPQMSNDGYIDSAELLSDGGVIVEITEFSTTKPGDYLNLYWDGRFIASQYIQDPQTYPWPWAVLIPAEQAPDGPHQVWYTVTDIAQNPSASPVSQAIIDRSHSEGLPPPLFTDVNSENSITWDSVIEQNGTHIHIPYTQGIFAAGNTAYIYWRERDALGNIVVGSETDFTHVINESDINKGFDLLVPPSYITVVQSTGSAEAWYSIVPPAQEAQSSQTATASVDMSGTAIYPAPFIPAGSDGWVDCGDITVNGIVIEIPANTQFVQGGPVTVYWQGYNASGMAMADARYQLTHILTSDEVSQGFSITVPAEFILPIGVGYAESWYQVSAPSTPGFSSIKSVDIDAEHCSLLPAPQFPAALDDGLIDDAEVASGNGTTLQVSYPGLSEGDTVTIFWFGYRNSPDLPVAGTSWTETRALSAQEAAAQQADFHIPADVITPIGEGYAQGRYQVMFTDGGIGSSAEQTVMIAVHTAQTLQMGWTTGAPWFDPTGLADR